jgi:hypothetical protein
MAALLVRFLASGAAILSGSITLIELHAPNNQIIWVNPHEVTDVREPLAAQHFARGARCIVYLGNHFLTVTENCVAVRKKLIAAGEPTP